MRVIEVTPEGGTGYRLRYAEPWEPLKNDPLTEEGAAVQYGGSDAEGDTRLGDLLPVPDSVRVLEVERSSSGDAPDGVAVYPKYRLEVAVLRCDEQNVPVPQAESCAQRLNTTDEMNRSATEQSGFFGAAGREGENAFGQHYYEFMTQVNDTHRFRRVVYFETAERLTAIRLGFEATPALSEAEVSQMISAFEVVDDAEDM